MDCERALPQGGAVKVNGPAPSAGQFPGCARREGRQNSHPKRSARVSAVALWCKDSPTTTRSCASQPGSGVGRNAKIVGTNSVKLCRFNKMCKKANLKRTAHRAKTCCEKAKQVKLRCVRAPMARILGRAGGNAALERPCFQRAAAPPPHATDYATLVVPRRASCSYLACAASI